MISRLRATVSRPVDIAVTASHWLEQRILLLIVRGTSESRAYTAGKVTTARRHLPNPFILLPDATVTR